MRAILYYFKYIYLKYCTIFKGDWEQEAYNIVGQMCSGIIGQAQIEAYINTNVYINFFLNIPKHGVKSYFHI